MQISVERVDELNRKLTVQVPEQTISEKVESRLKSLARSAKFDGFRPGKVPATLIRKRYGNQVREEVLSDLIESTFAQAVRDEKLRPAGLPEITAKAAGEGQGLEYEAAFEIFPEFVLMPVETLNLTRYTSVIGDEDVDRMLNRLREQRRTWQVVDRSAASGDRVTIDFQGDVGGEAIAAEPIRNFTVVLGGNQIVPGFEEQLAGASGGVHLSFDTTFPDDYANSQWAGKTGHFEVDVREVAESVLPNLDEEFARGFGIEDGSVEALRKDVTENMDREMRRALKARTKTVVLDALYEKNPLTLPKSLVEAELAELLAPYMESAKKGGKVPDESEMRQRYEPLARRRVALALILGKLIELNNIKAEPKRVREAVEDLARSYEQPDQVIHWYYSNQKHLQEVENLVVEDQVVEWVLEKANVRDEAIGFQDLMQASAQNAG